MNGDTLVDVAASVSSREEFAQFLDELCKNRTSHGDEWANATLDAFLAAMQRFTEGAEGYYRNAGTSIDCAAASWRLFADILLAAKVYE